MFQFHLSCEFGLASFSWIAKHVSIQWRSHRGGGGGSRGQSTPWQRKRKVQKIWNKMEKSRKCREIGKKRKYWEEKAKIGKVLSVCPSWQRLRSCLYHKNCDRATEILYGEEEFLAKFCHSECSLTTYTSINRTFIAWKQYRTYERIKRYRRKSADPFFWEGATVVGPSYRIVYCLMKNN